MSTSRLVDGNEGAWTDIRCVQQSSFRFGDIFFTTYELTLQLLTNRGKAESTASSRESTDFGPCHEPKILPYP
jgi:hypothetical protein